MGKDAWAETSREGAEQLLSTYLASHAANDLAGVLALFESDAVVEDPVGSPVHQGLAAIRAFYAMTHETNGPLSIERVGPVLIGGDELVAHVRAALERPGSPPAMDVIYVVRVSPAGSIASLRAWY